MSACLGAQNMLLKNFAAAATTSTRARGEPQKNRKDIIALYQKAKHFVTTLSHAIRLEEP